MTTATMAGRRAGTAKPRRRDGSAGGRTGAFLVMALFAVYTLVPVWWLVVSATKSSTDLFTTNSLWFSGLQLLRQPRRRLLDPGRHLRPVDAQQRHLLRRRRGDEHGPVLHGRVRAGQVLVPGPEPDRQPHPRRRPGATDHVRASRCT